MAGAERGGRWEEGRPGRGQGSPTGPWPPKFTQQQRGRTQIGTSPFDSEMWTLNLTLLYSKGQVLPI